jgi:hypothetical protein
MTLTGMGGGWVTSYNFTSDLDESEIHVIGENVFLWAHILATLLVFHIWCHCLYRVLSYKN